MRYRPVQEDSPAVKNAQGTTGREKGAKSQRESGRDRDRDLMEAIVDAVDELCRDLAVSRSRLYRLFEPLGGVVHYIRHRRLLDAHAALADVEDRRPIVAIAAERGFIDPAEFSRAFKREFGYRPSDARASIQSLPFRRRSTGGTLAELLHNLG